MAAATARARNSLVVVRVAGAATDPARRPSRGGRVVRTGVAQTLGNAACMLANTAEARKGAPAVLTGTDRTSYGQLAARAGALSELLVDAGVRPGDRVALLLRRE